MQSPSSRRAWIEINRKRAVLDAEAQVALLAEGVDRNDAVCRHALAECGRPPRGGRG